MCIFKQFYIQLSFLITGFLFSLNAFATIDYKQQMIHDRDSLLQLLQTERDTVQRLALLLNISDIDLNLEDNYTHVEQLWEEAISSRHEDMTISAGKSLFLRWNSKGVSDSADVWLDRCRQNFFGSTAEGALAYISMMREIRDFGSHPNLSDQLIKEKINIKQGDSPYKKMRLLFMLGILTSHTSANNSMVGADKGNNYLEEGLAIARALPLKESYSFYMQFLVSLGVRNPVYVEEMIELRAKYKAATSPAYRPYASCRSDIIAYGTLAKQGAKIGEEKADEYFAKFCDLTTKYPYECPSPYDYYYYNIALDYYLNKKEWKKALVCADSVTANAGKYKRDIWPFLKKRGICLARLGNYEGAYLNTLRHMDLKDSISKVNLSEKVVELKTQYEVDLLEYKNNAITERLVFIFIVSGILCILLILSVYYSRILHRKNYELVRQIKQQEAAEDRMVQIARSVPQESLSGEELLFLKIEELLKDKEVLTTPKLGRDQLAEMLSTNRTYIANAISVCTNGLSVSEFINMKRVKYGRYLLECPDSYTIDEIADLCGFGSRSRFHSAFRDYYNITPGEFKRALK